MEVEQVSFPVIHPNLNANQEIDELVMGDGTFNTNCQQNSISIESSKVVVNVKPTTHTSGSSAMVTSNITNYPWEFVYIPGNLVAVHPSGNFIAYAIIAPSSQNGIVRIISRKTGVRSIIKNITGLVKDLAFAYLNHRVLLAFVDQYSTLYVHEINEEEKTIRTQLLLEIRRSDDEESSEYQRVIWCSYIPDELADDPSLEEEDSEENLAYFLMVSNGPSAEIWQVLSLIEKFGSGLLDRTQLKRGSGYQVYEPHSAPITDAAFSPDGTALATASLDGYVKFFQVYMADNSDDSPRCLHQWKPHDGKPLSCLFFLDNHKKPSPDDQFWKFAVTGACNNSEIKTWSCETWQCNQVINFEMSGNSDVDSTGLRLKAAIDPSSKYVILSDIYRRVLYALILNQEPHSPENALTNGNSLAESSQSKMGVARVISITELAVQYPVIFLTITNAEWKAYKRWKHEHHANDIFRQDREEDDIEDDIDIIEGLVIKAVLINTKSIQEATARFQPNIPRSSNFLESCINTGSGPHNLSSQDSMVLHDGLTDLSMNTSSCLSDIGSPLNSNRVKKTSEEMSALDNNNFLNSLVSSKTPVSGKSIMGSNSASLNVSPSVTSPASAVKISPIGKDPNGHPNLSSPLISQGMNSVTSVINDGTVTNQQPVTMNLLTPESFSSPGRVEEENVLRKETETSNRAFERETEKYSKRSTPSPNGDLKSAALSLMLGVNSGSRLSSGDPKSGSVTQVMGQNNERSPKGILESAVSGSSRSSPVNILPPPPVSGLSSLPDAPLATSEVSHSKTSSRSGSVIKGSSPGSIVSGNLTMGGAIPNATALASSTSSPSLEVQQILHTHNGSVSAKGDHNHSKSMTDSLHSQDLNSKLASITTSSNVECNDNKGNSSFVDILSLLKSGEASLSHLTCEELEAEIKGPSSPTAQKVPGKITDYPGVASSLPMTSDLVDIFMNTGRKNGDHLPKTEFNQSNNESTDRSSGEIAELRLLILSYKSELEEKSKQNLDYTRNLSNQLDKCMKNVLQIQKTVEDMKKSQNKFLDQIPQIMSASSKCVIESNLKHEIRSALTPALSKCMEPIRGQLSGDIRNLVSNSESHLAESLTKAACSRSFIDNVSSSVASALSVHVQGACRDSYNKVVVPGFSAITQQVFSQLNEAFTRGTKEYMHHVETESQATRNALMDNLTTSSRTLETASSSLSSHATILMEALHKNMTQQSSLPDILSDRLKQLMRDEVTKVLQEHQSAIEARTSRAQTPAPATHTPTNPKLARQQIQQLISQGQFNSAFKQALSASDLSLVVFVCERINPQQLFNQTPCPLTQDVLLSLLNQLSHDLTTFTDLKTKYLEEAVMNLDTGHPVTREHMRQVLQELQRSLTSHIEQNPNHKKLKMLLLAVNHLVAA